MKKFSIAIHGGAGAITDVTKYKDSLRQIITSAKQLAESGQTALEVVEQVVVLLENDPIFNAGKGSVLNAEGMIDCDASIMDGKTNHAGAIAGVQGIKNPISLARMVMEKSQHVFLIGKGAEEFAQQENVNFEPQTYFATEARIQQLEDAKKAGRITLDHDDETEHKMGTVGAVMIDTEGNMASATSTGGVVNKKFGRVGDTPVVGAGTYAENGLAAISCTGYGEQFLETTLAKHIAEHIRHTEADAHTAAQAGIDYLVKKVNGLGGVIVVDKNYNIGFAHSTPLILGAGISHDSEVTLFF